MKRLLTSTAAIAVLALPASAAAAGPQSGAVLRVDRAHHKVEIVDSQHAVRSYSAPRRAARKLHAGVKVAYRTSGSRITSVHARGRAHKLAFYATVVSNASGTAVFRLGDGKRLRLHHRKRSVRVKVEGLAAGQVVLVTQVFDRRGNLAITFKLMPTPSNDPGDDDQDLSGTITALGVGGLTIQTDDGQNVTFLASSDVLDGLDVGDEVDVTYHAEADGTLVADDVEPTDDGSDPGTDDLDAIGTVTAIGAGSITVQVDGGGVMSFGADSDLLDGWDLGDRVDVSYYQDVDGSLVADDIESPDDSGDDPGPDPYDGSED
jgi:hypothetical protein